MQRKRHGTLLQSSLTAGERYRCYIPEALPPVPAIDMAEIAVWLEKATLALGELNGIVESTSAYFIITYMYVRKEAVLSSQIEGTASTLDDLLRYEATGAEGQKLGVPVEDVAEVSSYVAAMAHGLRRLEGGFPLSNRLIREVHKILLTNSRGQNKTPGEFRTTQNWIGGTRPGNARFVPPPPDRVQALMGEFEKFIHAEDMIPVLIKAALLHQHFETIHPFLGGNGRAGRLLVTLFLGAQGFLHSPCLYLSLFFKQHRALYYEKLSAPRETGDWESWLNFFLEGVAISALDAKKTLTAIQALFAADGKKLAALGRARFSVEKVFEAFKQKPVLSIAELTRITQLSKPTAIRAVTRLAALGIIKNTSGKKWGQIYAYSGFIALLTEADG